MELLKELPMFGQVRFLTRDKRVDDLFVDRMEQNENITSKFLNDPEFKKIITSFLIRQVYERVRKEMGVVA